MNRIGVTGTGHTVSAAGHAAQSRTQIADAL